MMQEPYEIVVKVGIAMEVMRRETGSLKVLIWNLIGVGCERKRRVVWMVQSFLA